MTRSKSLSPLVIRHGKEQGAIAQLRFLIDIDGELEEKVVTNIYTLETLDEFLSNWKKKKGKVVDLRSNGQNLNLKAVYECAKSSSKKNKPGIALS